MQVIKRDGTIQAFDLSRIKNAIQKAADSAQAVVKTESIAKKVEGRIMSDEIHIEVIQDFIEQELMNNGEYETVKNFILYRNEKQKQRDIGVLNLKNLPDIDVPWGNGVSYITYARTYKRAEDQSFRDTILRVLVACQKQLHVGFTQDELRIAYEHLMKLRGSVAGRFLWTLGTETVNRHGLLSLQNCAFVKYDNAVRTPCWVKDCLMLGCGVGVNVQRHNVDKIPPVLDIDIQITRKDTKDADFIIPDSREGWCSFLERVLEAFFYKGKSFTYSTLCIRNAGSQINGFGGVASGGDVLCDGIESICKVLRNRRGQKLRPVDCMDIIDIIGSIVVAGNVRRCLPKGALVHTIRGLIPIEDVVVGDKVLTSDGSYHNVSDTIYQGKQKLVEIHTETGVFHCTPTHRMAVLDRPSSMEHMWKMAGELKSGDFLATTRIPISGKITTMPSYNDKPPIEIDSGMAWFLGFYANNLRVRSSLLYSSSSFEVMCPSYQIALKVKEQVERIDDKCRIQFHKMDDNQFIAITNNENTQVATFLSEHCGPCIPGFIRESGLEARKSFIAGIADSQLSSHIVLCKSKKWVLDVQNLCYSCGFETKYNTHYYYREQFTYHVLDVVSDHAKSIISEIPVLHNMSVCGTEFCDWLFHKVFSWHATSSQNHRLCATKVLSVNQGKEEETYDITVDDKHEFFCNGYLTHNSAIIVMGDSDDEEYMSAKRWDLGCVPNYRAMSNNSVICNDINELPESFWEGYKGNGEPYGLINLKLARRIGRIRDGTKYPDPRVDGFNPCVIGSTIIATTDGDKPVSELVGRQFTATVANREYPSSEEGFWFSGHKPVLKLRLKNGFELTATHNHVLRVSATDLIDVWKDLQNISVGDNLLLNDLTYSEIESIEDAGEADVYDCSIEDAHYYSSNGIVSHNCAEQSLANFETCCLAELFLPNIESYEQLQSVATILYRICKHSLLLPCHHPETETIVHENMRMGIGVSGWLQSTQEQKDWMSLLYEHLRQYDVGYSKKLGVPTSVKLTTCKPSGTLSLLPGITPGCHPAIYKYYIRRIRIASTNPLVDLCRKHGYHIEPQLNFDGSFDPKTMVVEFPCKAAENAVLAENMSAIDQLEVMKDIQTRWSDNSVSISCYYRKEELPAIREWLKKNYNNSVKTVSFILHYDSGFKQMPYENITQERYEELIEKVRPITSGVIDTDDSDLSLECAGGKCPVK